MSYLKLKRCQSNLWCDLEFVRKLKGCQVFIFSSHFIVYIVYPPFYFNNKCIKVVTLEVNLWKGEFDFVLNMADISRGAIGLSAFH